MRPTARFGYQAVLAGAVGVLLCAGLVTPAQAAEEGRDDAGSADKAPAGPGKSIGFYVGKNLTEDGSVLLGGFGHEPSSHWLEIVPRRHFDADATTTVGITGEAEMPGELMEIPQVRRTNKYITSNYSEFAGFPAPLTNGGLNEHGVAARDIWSPTNPRLLDLTEKSQKGPNYSDLSRIAMERASTAREAVQILGRLIDEHGYSSYGGNSHLFADENEGWIFVDYGGNKGLWAAERLGPDEVRVSYPGYLEPFPIDYQKHPDEYLASDNLIDFATERGWFEPEGKKKFDVQSVYGDLQPDNPKTSPTHPVGYNDQGTKERELAEQLAPVSLEDMLAYVRDPRWSHDRSGYGQVARLRHQEHAELNALWTAVTGAVTTPYVPIYIGAEDVPPEYKQHRYMTKDAASEHLASDYAPLEATRYATRTFKRLMYHTCENPRTFLKPVTAEIEAFEDDMLDEQSRLRRRAEHRLADGDGDAARDLLTHYVDRRLLDGLDLGEDLVREVEHRTRKRFGIRMPEGRKLPGETRRPESQSMNIGGLPGKSDDIVYCYREGLGDYPREHGSYDGLVGRLLDHRAGDSGHGHEKLSSTDLAGAAGVGLFLMGAAAGALLGRRRRSTR